MAKIIVSLADAGEQEEVAGALRLKKYAISAVPAMAAGDSPKKVAARLLKERAQVAVMDYLPEDAASVKVLQAATEDALAPRFIFVLPDGAPVSHILMAVNEGAAAIIERPINLEALGNYVERAINGPSRFRGGQDSEASAAAEISDLEKEAKAMKMQLASNRKLISYLLATPAASQHRSAMVVSDSTYQREQLRKLFEEHGFHVFLATDPEDGLATALQERPRVVISDLEMEGKNGIEFCRELKITNKFMPCFFIICTANSEKIDSVMAPGNGVDGCVLKPSSESDSQELIAAAAMGLLL